MIGVFDSGEGGLCAAAFLQKICPKADFVFYADRGNAPYGTKSERQLVTLTSDALRRLFSLGCDRVLIACCTASTVYPLLPEDLQRKSVPIIRPAAKAAVRATKNRRIAVIGTLRTVGCHAFRREIVRLAPTVSVTELPAQPLVAFAERGLCDGSLDREATAEIDRIAGEIRQAGADTLILGCTHFSRFSEEFGKRLPGTVRIDSARIGADTLTSILQNTPCGKVRTLSIKNPGKETTLCRNTAEAASTMRSQKNSPSPSVTSENRKSSTIF